MTRQPGIAFAITLASIALVGPLSIHIYLPLLPAVKAALSLPEWLAQLMFTAAIFGMAIATLFWGALSDRFGRRPILLTGLSLFLAGSLVCAAAPSAAVLLAGRLIQAIGAGAGVALVRTIARDAYGPERLVKAIAYLTMFYAMGPMLAPIAGGVLADAAGWRYAFLFSASVGAVIATAAYFVIYETRRPPAENRSQLSPGMIRDVASLFRNVRFSCFVLQTGLNSGVFLVMASAASFIMTGALGRTATEFALWFLLFPSGLLLGNFVSSRLGSRPSNESMVLGGASITVLTVAAQGMLLFDGGITPLVLFLPGFLVSFAQGISMPYAQAGAISAIPRIAGTAAGIGVFTQTLVGAMFAQLFGALADGTIWPMILTAGAAAVLGLAAAVLPYLLSRT